MMKYSTDMASVMICKDKGLVKRIKVENAGILIYQSIIHFRGKLSTTLQEVMDSLIKLINFMRSHFPLLVQTVSRVSI